MSPSTPPGPVDRTLRGLKALSPNCREASRLQSRALDGPLSLTERIGLRIHLLLCKWCARYGRQIRFLRSATRAATGAGEVQAAGGGVTLSPEARERLTAAIRSAERRSGDGK